MQGAIDAGLGLAAAGERTVERLKDGLDRERVLAQHMRLESLQLVRQRFEGRAHMRRGVGIAVADVTVIGCQAHDPAMGNGGGRQRKGPALVFERHFAGLEFDALDDHGRFLSGRTLNETNSG